MRLVFLIIVLSVTSCAERARAPVQPDSPTSVGFPPDYEADPMEIPFCDIGDQYVGKVIALHGVLKPKDDSWALAAAGECNSDTELSLIFESRKSCSGEDHSRLLEQLKIANGKTAGNILAYGALQRHGSTYAFSVTCLAYFQLFEPCCRKNMQQ